MKKKPNKRKIEAVRKKKKTLRRGRAKAIASGAGKRFRKGK